MAKKIKPTANLLFESENQSLSSMVNKIYHLEGINQVLQEMIEKPLIDHCRVANIRNGCIIIETESPTWATLLRYQFPQILQKLRTTPGLEGISSIKYIICPPSVDTKAKKPREISELSPSSAKMLQETAEGIKNKQLRETLQRIANRAGVRD